MYPLYFYVCLLASVANVIVLILLAVYPLQLPLVVKTVKQTQPVVRIRKARSPTRTKPPSSYWTVAWEDDDDDL